MEVPDASEPTAEGEEVILRNAKIITLVIVGVLSLIASVVPWIISHRRLRNSEYLFSVLNCLSGGVVLGAALSHLYADADGDLREYFGEDDYPYTALFCGASLMFLYVLERLLMSGKHSHSEIVFDESTAINKALVKDEEGGRPDVSVVSNALGTTAIQAFIFLGALSVHSVFEGLGLGASEEATGVYATIIAVASHKALEAFALGLAIFKAKFRTLVSIGILFGYALATPFGGIVGMLVGDAVDSQASHLVSGLLVSIAAGSFLYIALIEILPMELHKETTKLKHGIKLGVMIFGWAFMVMIAKFA